MKNRNTIGMDMGDRNHTICTLDPRGKVISRNTVSNTAVALRTCFKKLDPALFAIEAGTHSAWVSRVLEEMGHEVLVGNPRKLRVIWDSDRKDDVRDAEMLARIARFDPELLYPIHHRSRDAQLDLLSINARDLLVKTRSMQITHIRNVVKGFGERISKCSTQSFHKRAREELSGELLEMLEPLLESIEALSAKITQYDKQIEKTCLENYPETKVLRKVQGVGAITALAYVLTLEDPKRFRKSRDVGPFLGLVPKRDQSGSTDKQLSITKAGNSALRRLLVGSAQYILGAFGPDCELREFGLNLAARGGKNAKKRATVAVARKLAVMLHRLWIDEAEYHPFHQQVRKELEHAA
jgi:transposase